MSDLDTAARSEVVTIRARWLSYKAAYETAKATCDRLYGEMLDAEKAYEQALATYLVTLEADAKLLSLGG